MKKSILVLTFSTVVAMNSSLYAQLGFHMPTSKPVATAPNAIQVTVPPGDLLKLITLSTDQGMMAMDKRGRSGGNDAKCDQ